MRNPKLPVDISVICHEPLIANALFSLLTSMSDRVTLNSFENNLLESIQSIQNSGTVFIFFVEKNKFMNILEIIRNTSDSVKLKSIAIIPHSNPIFFDLLLNSGLGGILTTRATPMQLRDAILSVDQFIRYLPTNYSGNSFGQRRHTRDIRANEKYNLCEREIKFLQLCCTNMSYKEIGDTLSISKRTAEHFAERLWQKLGYSSRIELVIFAITIGIYPQNNQFDSPQQG